MNMSAFGRASVIFRSFCLHVLFFSKNVFGKGTSLAFLDIHFPTSKDFLSEAELNPWDWVLILFLLLRGVSGDGPQLASFSPRMPRLGRSVQLVISRGWRMESAREGRRGRGSCRRGSWDIG